MRDDPDPRTEYAGRLSGPPPPYLTEVERLTHLRTVAPQMMSGRLQGRLLALLSTLRRPDIVLDLGTFTGYSALCLAEGLAPGGRVHTVESNPETADLARRLIGATPLSDLIQLHEIQAEDAIDRVDGPFDLVFLDCDKLGYPGYFKQLRGRLSPGGLLIADNVLWDGKVGHRSRDRVVEALDRYNRLVAADPDYEVVLLPFRDGLSVARRKA